MINCSASPYFYQAGTESIQNYTLVSNITGIDASTFCEEWIASICLFVVLLIILLYLNLATWCHHMRVKRAQSVGGKCKNSRPESSMKCIWYLLISAATISIIKVCLDLVETLHGFTSHDVCNRVRAAKAVFYALCYYPLYTILWIRQRVFYQTPGLKYLSNGVVRALSFFSLIIMICSGIVPPIMYISTRGYASTFMGCKMTYSNIHKELPGKLGLALTVIFQFMLLGLFMYPLLKHNRTSRRFNCDTSRQLKLMKSVTIMTLVVVVYDLSRTPFEMLTAKHLSVIRHVYYSYGLAVLELCIIGSFIDWRQRLFPFCSSKADFLKGIDRRMSSTSTLSTKPTDASTVV